jgi:DHA2 family multidrug resistance protein
LLADMNFASACVLGFFIGMLLFSTMALLPSMMQNLLGYPVAFSGMVSMSRGVGSLLTMFAVGQLIGRVNVRLILILGLTFGALALWQMTHFSLQMDTRLLVISGFFQGISMGLIFVPLSAIAFSTIDGRFRTEGAGLFTLIRNIGSSVGISVVQTRIVTGTEAHRLALVEHARPDNPLFQAYLRAPLGLDTAAGLQRLSGVINRQASMQSYIDAFGLLLGLTVLCAPLVLLMRTPKRKTDNSEAMHAAVE